MEGNDLRKENMKIMMALTSGRLAPGCISRARGIGPDYSYRSSIYYPDPRYTCRQGPFHISTHCACKQFKNRFVDESLYNMPKKPIGTRFTGNWASDPLVRACFKRPRQHFVCTECGCNYSKGSGQPCGSFNRSKVKKCKPNKNNKPVDPTNSKVPEEQPDNINNPPNSEAEIADAHSDQNPTDQGDQNLTDENCKNNSSNTESTTQPKCNDLNNERTDRDRMNCTKPNCFCNKGKKLPLVEKGKLPACLCGVPGIMYSVPGRFCFAVGSGSSNRQEGKRGQNYGRQITRPVLVRDSKKSKSVEQKCWS